MLLIFVIGILYSINQSLKDDIQFKKLWLYKYLFIYRFFNLGLASKWYDNLPVILRYFIRPFFDAFHLSFTLCGVVVLIGFPMVEPWLKFNHLIEFALFSCFVYFIAFEATRLALQWKNYSGLTYIKNLKLK